MLPLTAGAPVGPAPRRLPSAFPPCLEPKFATPTGYMQIDRLIWGSWPAKGPIRKPAQQPETLTTVNTPPPIARRPSDAIVLASLKDGYWDRTELIGLADGSRRVRKRTKGSAAAGPWGLAQLRGEIRYLCLLPAEAAACFPTVLAAWGQSDADAGAHAEAGYEMAYLEGYRDAGDLARNGRLDQAEIDRFQDAVAGMLFGRVHAGEGGRVVAGATVAPLSAHVADAVRHSLGCLCDDPALASLINAPCVRVNGRACLGARAALDTLIAGRDALGLIDAPPQVRIHGDFFLENILWGPEDAAPEEKRPVFIDPVSVAGVAHGPPLFDLVKYESYARGELLALRSHWVEVEGFDATPGTLNYTYRVQWDQPGMAPFRGRDWHSRLHAAYVARYGEPDPRAYRLLDGYFSAVMAVNTHGVQRRARLLKCVLDLNPAV
jgi:hypothetical protein